MRRPTGSRQPNRARTGVSQAVVQWSNDTGPCSKTWRRRWSGSTYPFIPTLSAEAIALRDRLDARIAEATAALETTGWWMEAASASMTGWLRAHARMARRGPADAVGGRRLRALPVCARAYADGTLPGGQIEAIVSLLDDEVVASSPPTRPSWFPIRPR